MAGYPTDCTHGWIILSSMQNVNHSSQQGLDHNNSKKTCSSISRQVSHILDQES